MIPHRSCVHALATALVPAPTLSPTRCAPAHPCGSTASMRSPSLLAACRMPGPPALQMYVLSGSGFLSGCCECVPGGAHASPAPQWPLKSGVSALSWANSTCLTAAAKGADGQQDDSLAVLKFLIPVRMLDPSSASYGDAQKARALLRAHSASAQHHKVGLPFFCRLAAASPLVCACSHLVAVAGLHAGWAACPAPAADDDDCVHAGALWHFGIVMKGKKC